MQVGSHIVWHSSCNPVSYLKQIKRKSTLKQTAKRSRILTNNHSEWWHLASPPIDKVRGSNSTTHIFLRVQISKKKIKNFDIETGSLTWKYRKQVAFLDHEINFLVRYKREIRPTNAKVHSTEKQESHHCHRR